MMTPPTARRSPSPARDGRRNRKDGNTNANANAAAVVSVYPPPVPSRPSLRRATTSPPNQLLGAASAGASGGGGSAGGIGASGGANAAAVAAAASAIGSGGVPSGAAPRHPGAARPSHNHPAFLVAGDGFEPSPIGGSRISDGFPEVSLTELHVFCRAVRVSVVDGERGEIVLGSLEGMSMSVAATEDEVEVKFNLASLQIDSHMPG